MYFCAALHSLYRSTDFNTDFRSSRLYFIPMTQNKLKGNKQNKTHLLCNFMHVCSEGSLTALSGAYAQRILTFEHYRAQSSTAKPIKMIVLLHSFCSFQPDFSRISSWVVIHAFAKVDRNLICHIQEWVSVTGDKKDPGSCLVPSPTNGPSASMLSTLTVRISDREFLPALLCDAGH